MSLRGACIAVTGATGFLGRYVVDALLARGAHVVAVVRNPGKAPELAAHGVALRRADLAEPAALAAAFAGADAVVSNAALLSLSHFRPADYLATNVQGTRHVFEAAARAGVRRAVHVSSAVVYAGRSGRAHREDDPLREAQRVRPWNAYAISKALSEREAWRLAAEHGIGLTTLRPDGIFGAFDENFMRVHKAFVRRRWLSAYPAFMLLPLVYAGDVAEAVALALEQEVAVERAYNVAGEAHTAWAFLRAWREAGGATPRLVLPVPAPLRRRLDSRRARAELGWRTRPLVEGLRETLAAEAAGPAARRMTLGSAT